MIELILLLIALILAVPIFTLFVQILAAMARIQATKVPTQPRPRLAVLVPAHNEQAVIDKTLASIFRQLQKHDRLVVVADNCSDQTADIARRRGAEVIVRTDLVLRGKGYALEHGLNFIGQTCIPDVVIFIDADCELQDDCVDRLARLCVQTSRPIQATYLMNPPRPPTRVASIVSFAWKVNDFVRPLGWYRLGFPCRLAGSGMAFPWMVISSTQPIGGYLAEDVKLGLDLALGGNFPLFCPEAVVTSDVIAGAAPSPSQRARWDHGNIEIMIRYLPRLVIAFLKTWRLPLITMALDLSVPPLALLALALGTLVVLAFVNFIVTNEPAPIIMSGISAIVFVTAVLLAWWRYGREMVPFRWLVFAPVYAISKIPLYGHFLFKRQRVWVKGERDARGR